MKHSKIGVIGCGSWGTTIAHLVGQAGHDALLWGRNRETLKEIKEKRTNKEYVGDLKISERVQVTGDLKVVAEQCEIIFVAVPSKVFRSVSKQLGDYTTGDQILVSCTKGIEEQSFRFMSEILREETCCKKVGALSGPNIAKEIINGDPSGVAIASLYDEVIEKVRDALGQKAFKVYGNRDIKGLEIGGALKNIIAIASGIATGLKFENNSRSFLITRGVAEISRLGAFFGARSETFLGLSGIGDIIATCYSLHSRNNRFGRCIAEGKSLEEAQKEIKMAIEGVSTTKAVYEFSKKFNIFMPITEGVYRVLFESAKIEDILEDLMTVREKYEGEEDRMSSSRLKHMLINKYPSPEYLL